MLALGCVVIVAAGVTFTTALFEVALGQADVDVTTTLYVPASDVAAALAEKLFEFVPTFVAPFIHW